MSGRMGQGLLAAGVVAGGVYMFFPRGQKPNLFETQGAKNVGDRFSAGGGSTTHTPGVATKRGDSESNASGQQRVSGIGSPYFDENHAAQKVGYPSTIEKAFNSAKTGSEKGK